jgi:phosphoserine phosphatase
MVDAMKHKAAKHYLLASDFDQTLSHDDSGFALSELLGVSDFEQKVAGLAHSHLVQQGGELAYLIRHDPAFRGVRREHLVEAGRRVRLKAGLRAFVDFLARGVEGNEFSFCVVSAAPREVVVSALDGIVPPENIFGTEFEYDAQSGEVRSIRRVRAGFGKVAVLDELGQRLGIPTDRTIYVGDGSSDIHVMLHVNNGDGFTIAVSENRQLARIARSTVLSEHAGSVLVPILDQLLGMRSVDIRSHLESTGLVLDEWQRARTDRVMIREFEAVAAAGGAR